MLEPSHPYFDSESVRALAVALAGVVGEVRHTSADDAFSPETRQIADDLMSQAMLVKLRNAGWTLSRPK